MAVSSRQDEDAAGVVEIGAPFSGMTDILEPGAPQTVYAANVLCRNGYFDAVPGLVEMPRLGSVFCNMGHWSDKEGDNTLELWIGGDPVLSGNAIVLTVSYNGALTTHNLTTLYGEIRPEGTHYSFAAFQRKVFFCAGQWVYYVDRDTLALSQLTLIANPSPYAVDIPYLVGRLSASRVENHLDGLWFTIPRRHTMATSLTLSTTDPQIPDVNRIVTGGQDMHPGDIWFTDAKEFASIPVMNYFAVDGDGSQMQEIMSWQHQLLAWTKNGMYTVTGDGGEGAPFVLDVIQRNAGCAAPASVALVGDRIFWQGRGCVYSYSPSEGVKEIRGTSWMWGTGTPLTEGLLNMLPFIANPRSYTWQPSANGQGANYADTHYWLTGGTGVLCVEVATGSVSVLYSTGTFDMIAMHGGAEGAIPQLVVSWNLAIAPYTITPGTPNASDLSVGNELSPLVVWRMPMSPVQRTTINGVTLRVSDTAVTGTWGTMVLDDAVRIGSATMPTKADERTGAIFPTPPGGSEESGTYGSVGTIYGGGGGTFPRWLPTGPIRLVGRSLGVTGTDFLVWTRLYGHAAFTIERAAVLVAKAEETQR